MKKKSPKISFFSRKKIQITNFLLLHISSSYAKIVGETNFHALEIPRSGSKAKDGERERKKERLNDGNNNGQATHGARKHAWRTQAAWANLLYDCVSPT